MQVFIIRVSDCNKVQMQLREELLTALLRDYFKTIEDTARRLYMGYSPINVSVEEIDKT